MCGAPLLLPTKTPLAKKSTRVTLPSVSETLARSTVWAGPASVLTPVSMTETLGATLVVSPDGIGAGAGVCPSLPGIVGLTGGGVGTGTGNGAGAGALTGGGATMLPPGIGAGVGVGAGVGAGVLDFGAFGV